jgi:hypothetical protein
MRRRYPTGRSSRVALAVGILVLAVAAPLILLHRPQASSPVTHHSAACAPANLCSLAAAGGKAQSSAATTNTPSVSPRSTVNSASITPHSSGVQTAQPVKAEWDVVYRGSGSATYQTAGADSQSFAAPDMFFADYLASSPTDIYTISGSASSGNRNSSAQGSWTVELDFVHGNPRLLKSLGLTFPQPNQTSYNFPLETSLEWLDMEVGSSRRVSTNDAVYFVTLTRPQNTEWHFDIRRNTAVPPWPFGATSAALTISADSLPPWRNLALNATLSASPPDQQYAYTFGLTYCASRGQPCRE